MSSLSSADVGLYVTALSAVVRPPDQSLSLSSHHADHAGAGGRGHHSSQRDVSGVLCDAAGRDDVVGVSEAAGQAVRHRLPAADGVLGLPPGGGVPVPAAVAAAAAGPRESGRQVSAVHSCSTAA